MNPTPPRIAPSPRVAWLAGLAYGPLLPLMLVALGVDYTRIADSTSNVRTGVAVPMMLLTVAVASLVTWLGWWKAILWEPRRAPFWLLAVPVLMLVTLFGAVDLHRIAERDIAFLAWAAVGTLCVGFCEEAMFRGVAVVGFRAGHPEWRVWLLSSLMFSLIHAWNVLAGADFAGTLSQLQSSFLFGSFLYVTRRATGTILVPMALHAAWDWTLFAGASPGHTSGTMNVVAALSMLGMVVVSLLGAKALFTAPPDAGGATATKPDAAA